MKFNKKMLLGVVAVIVAYYLYKKFFKNQTG